MEVVRSGLLAHLRSGGLLAAMMVLKGSVSLASGETVLMLQQGHSRLQKYCRWPVTDCSVVLRKVPDGASLYWHTVCGEMRMTRKKHWMFLEAGLIVYDQEEAKENTFL